MRSPSKNPDYFKFHPISLASCVLKLIERIINTRLVHYVEQNDILSTAQKGFWKANSCQLALAEAITDIYTSLSRNESTVCVSLDIKSAFDEVCPYKMNDILKSINIPPRIRFFILKLMTNRKLYFKIANDLEGSFLKSTGVPQGCVSADDTLFYYSHQNTKEAVRLMEETLVPVLSNFDSSKMKISTQITVYIIFTNAPYSSVEKFKLKFNGCSISPAEIMKHLGVIFYYKMTCIPHGKYLIDKTTKLLNIIRMLRGSWWGGHPLTYTLA